MLYQNIVTRDYPETNGKSNVSGDAEEPVLLSISQSVSAPTHPTKTKKIMTLLKHF